MTATAPTEGEMGGMKDLLRDYERARFPPERRLDLQGEGPRSARERALQWIQSRAHEAPGQELLLIVERGRAPGRPGSAVAVEVQRLLTELEGKLIDWWQPFAQGSLAIRIAAQPSMYRASAPSAEPVGEGRTEETAGAARPSAREDIPPELLDLAQRTAELRIEREGFSIRILDVVLREVWIEAQALAMERRVSFEDAMRVTFERERGKGMTVERDDG
jgi:hypothetical protein